MVSNRIKVEAAPDLSGRGGWIALDDGGRIEHLLFERVGTVRARVIGPDAPLPAHFFIVNSLAAPVRLVSPESGTASEPVGEPGDWILIYRSGKKEVILQVLPGVYKEAQARFLAEEFPETIDFYPPDWDPEDEEKWRREHE